MCRYQMPRAQSLKPSRRIDGCDYVFPSRTKTPFSGFGKTKARLDKAVLLDMQKRAKKGAEIAAATELDPPRSAAHR